MLKAYCLLFNKLETMISNRKQNTQIVSSRYAADKMFIPYPQIYVLK